MAYQVVVGLLPRLSALQAFDLAKFGRNPKETLGITDKPLLVSAGLDVIPRLITHAEKSTAFLPFMGPAISIEVPQSLALRSVSWHKPKMSRHRTSDECVD